MTPLRRATALAFALAGLHGAPALALTEQQLREAIAEDVPDGAQFKPWRGMPDRTLVAWADYRSITTETSQAGTTPGGPDVPDVVDLTVLVLQTSTGKLLQRYHEDRAYASLAVQFDRVELDTAGYTLAAGRRAFGVRLWGRHRGCGAEETATLRLLEPDGSRLNEVLVLPTTEHLATCDCGEGYDIVRTVAIGKATTHGHADLLVHERRDDTPDGSTHPRRCHPAVKHAESTTTLRFDGVRYPVVGP